jgi:hypothetical protein
MVSMPPPPSLATAAAAAREKRSERASRVGMEEPPEGSGGSLFLDLHILHHYTTCIWIHIPLPFPYLKFWNEHN